MAILHRTQFILLATVTFILLFTSTNQNSFAQSIPPASLTSAPPAAPTIQLPRLAQKGDFAAVLHILKSDQSVAGDPQVANLIADLDRHERNHTEQAKDRREQYEKAFAEMNEKIQEDDLEGALIKAVDAHSLSENPSDLLVQQTILDLVSKAQLAANGAEESGNWLQVLNLYRLLDLLYDDSSRFRDHVKRASSHVQVLRLYAPKELKRLYAERAKLMGKDQPDRLVLEDETWESKLQGIDQAMLRQALAQAASHHVDTGGYTPLLRGAIDGLVILIDTHALQDVFTGLANNVARGSFRAFLMKLRNELDQDNATLNFVDAAAVIDRIAAINERTIKLPTEVLVFELGEGATSTLDEFSAVIWPHEKDNFSRNTQGKFYGVGIQISNRDDRLVVVSPLEDTPAQKAGIKAGDIIATVDNKDTSLWTLERAVREITGPEGSDVVLGIERVEERDLLYYTLTRDEIVIDSVRGWKRNPNGGWNYFIDPNSKIGYLRISQFIPQTAADMDLAIEKMRIEAGGPKGLIIDLRFNPGGLLSSAIEIADRFVYSGPIVSTVGPRGNRTSQFRARPANTYQPFPVVVLINQGSASASEIVSGALQDFQRGMVIGTRSFGKGSVQDLFKLAGGSAYLKLTTQYYVLPRGRIIHKGRDSQTWGIEPDLIVEMTTQQVADAIEFRQNLDVLRDAADQPNDPNAEQPDRPIDLIEKSLDPQLEAAMLVLKTELVAQHIRLAKLN